MGINIWICLVWRMFAAYLCSTKEMLNMQKFQEPWNRITGELCVYMYVLFNTHLHYQYCTNVEFERLYCWDCISAHHSWLDWFKDNLKDLRFRIILVWKYTVDLKELLSHIKSLGIVFILFLVKVNNF